MEIDFDGDGDLVDFCTVPGGTYKCSVAEVRTGATRAGDIRWSLRLVVAEGPHIGSTAAWDSIVFSVRGRARARAVLQALGLPTKGKVHIEPEHLEQRQVMVKIQPCEYQSPSGSVVKRNEVPWDGYSPCT